MQTVWTLDADFTNAHFMQTICTLGIRPLLTSNRLIAHQEPNAIKYAQSLYMHTWCRQICRLYAHSVRQAEKVCIKSANAHFVQTLYADCLQT